ncbi:MAG: quinone oxidoreductase family protein [Candidatus Binataceae bacterium]|jgi:NADPH2:quinone reductase
MKCKAIVVHEIGGPEVLKFEDVEVPAPGPGQALVRHRAVGLNFVDIYVRSGVYPAPSLPYTPGTEGAGVVEAVGPNVNEVRVGDRVAYVGGPLGSYSEARVMPARVLVKLPDKIDEKTAAAAMLKGLTAEYLVNSTYAVKAGDTILLHAAAGGTGLILSQWAKHLGATVIGTVGSDEKAKIAAAHGCAHTINYSREDFVARVNEITGGKKVPVVYDSVGQTTFMKSLDCLQPRGLMVSFGQASGVVPPFSINILSGKGSLYLTRPTLATYTARREDLEAAARKLFEVLASGAVRCEVKRTFKLADAAAAHRALGDRETTGSSILLP